MYSKSISWSDYLSSISYFIIVISSHVFGCWNNWESGPRCRNTGVEPICSVSYLGQPHHHHHFAIILIVAIFHITYIENCCLISHHMYRTIENRDPGAGGRAYWKLIALICCQTTSQQNQEGWFWSSTLWLTDWQIQGVSKKKVLSWFSSCFSSRGRILHYPVCFGIRILSPFHLSTQIILKTRNYFRIISSLRIQKIHQRIWLYTSWGAGLYFILMLRSSKFAKRLQQCALLIRASITLLIWLKLFGFRIWLENTYEKVKSDL